MKKILIIGLLSLMFVPCIKAAGHVEVKDEKQFNEIIKSDGLVLVDFYATWCGPCKMMAPVLEQLEKDCGKSVTVVKVDIDKNKALAKKYMISAVPTFILLKDGKVEWTHRGATDLDSLKEVIEKYQNKK